MQEKLENFINKMDGDLISLIPNVKPTFLPMGGSAKVDYILVVEKLKISQDIYQNTNTLYTITSEIVW